MNMKSGGYKYQIHARTGNIALVSGTNKYGSITWEVWKIRQEKKDRMNMGKLILAGADRGPVPGDWGIYGFSYGNEEKARVKCREMILQEA